MHFDFTEKLIIVTGGTKGIGKNIVKNFLELGGRVIATYSRDIQSAESLEKEVNSPNLICTKCDVSSYEAVEEFYNDIDKKGMAIDILVNNAGIRKDSIVGMMKKDEWQRVIDVNLTGVFNMSKFAVMNMMRQKFGRIISITSPGRYFGFPGQANYSASKAGIVALTKSLSKEVAKRKITVNCVSPGFIETELIKDLEEGLIKEYKKTVPLKRFGKVEEVSPIVLFLASNYASYITGSVYDVDGGI